MLKNFFCVSGIQKSTGIRLLNVDIPPHAIRGQNARLTCKYDLEGDNLYSIKWYRNGHEFYRYIPSDHPQTTIFNGNGINVDVSNIQSIGRISYLSYDNFIKRFMEA